ncbi:MAG: sugar phosphate nucleotidyltransferase [Hyphomicrobiales bacterium]|nr:sugar phosphate nucleotidyltransferase [Hyphomicrobiales bacterium]
MSESLLMMTIKPTFKACFSYFWLVFASLALSILPMVAKAQTIIPVQAKPAPRTQAKAPKSPSKAVKAVPVAASSSASRKVSAAASKTRGASSDRFVIIMAGGRGERFWPVSREKTPKQLIRLLGDRSFLQQAVDRVRPLVPAANILIITNAVQAAEVRRQLPALPKDLRSGHPGGGGGRSSLCDGCDGRVACGSCHP